MKFGRNVIHVNMHQLMKPCGGYDVISQKIATIQYDHTICWGDFHMCARTWQTCI